MTMFFILKVYTAVMSLAALKACVDSDCFIIHLLLKKSSKTDSKLINPLKLNYYSL